MALAFGAMLTVRGLSLIVTLFGWISGLFAWRKRRPEAMAVKGISRRNGERIESVGVSALGESGWTRGRLAVVDGAGRGYNPGSKSLVIL